MDMNEMTCQDLNKEVSIAKGIYVSDDLGGMRYSKNVY